MSETQPPNVLWVCTDQQRFDTIHSLGNKHIRTPNIDRLVAEGVAFTRAYCQSPICTPSRASFLTGCYPDRIHQHRNGNASFSSDVPLGTRLLASAGYDCGLVGKLHLSAADGRVEPRPDDGYDYFAWNHHPAPSPSWPPEHDAYQRWLLDKGVDWESAYNSKTPTGWANGDHYRAGIPAEFHQTTWCAEEAIAFLSARRDGPWLLSVNPFDPHPPLDPPPEFLARMDPANVPSPSVGPGDLELQRDLASIDFQSSPQAPESYDADRMVAAYYAQIELIDEQFGRIMKALEQTGQRSRTIVIFTSDHGEMLGDHGLRLKGCRFYEGLVHVPLIISWPERFQQDVRSDELVELIDILPTLLEAASLPIPEHVQGRSLLPILLGGTTGSGGHREVVHCTYQDALNLPSHSRGTMIFDGRHKLSVYHGTDLGELYDLRSDPDEFRNLWAEPQAQGIRNDLLACALDQAVLMSDVGQARIGDY